jgi:hypothetical protein
MNIGELAALFSVAAIIGAAAKWIISHLRQALVANDEHELKQVNATAAAAEAISTAASSLVTMLQTQLVANAAHLAEVLKQLTIANASLLLVQELEAKCQDRLDLVEAELERLNGNNVA